MFTADVLLGALAIFFLRIINNTIGTISVIVIVRQQRWLASVLGFLEALIWAVVIADIIKDLSNWLNILAYAGGFAVGNYVGMVLEKRYVASYVSATIIVPDGGHELAVALRERGFGVTETRGIGHDGGVTLLHSVIIRQHLPHLLETVAALNPEAFVTADEVRTVHRGWIQSLRNPGKTN